MFTDTEARSLLHQAADTIEVGPAASFAQPPRHHRRPLVVLVAAAAVIALVVSALVWRSDRTAPVVRPHGEVTVPSIVGYPTGKAMALLKSVGLEPRLEKKLSCAYPGRAIRTKPWAGTRVRAGSSVVLVGVPPNAALPCPYNSQDLPKSVAWQLVDLARGVGSPRFADRVRLWVNHRPAVTVSATRAQAPESWPTCGAAEPRCPGTALDVIRADADFAENTDHSFLQPELVLSPLSQDGSGFAFSVSHHEVGVAAYPRWSVSVEIDQGGAIASVGLHYSGSPPRAVPLPFRSSTDPTRLGRHFVAFARGRTDTLPTGSAIRPYVQHNLLRTLSAAEIQDPEKWRFCSTIPERCSFSAVDVVAGTPGRVVIGMPTSEPERCFDRAGSPAPVGQDVAAVVLRPATELPCSRAWAVYLYREHARRLSGVDLLLRAR